MNIVNRGSEVNCRIRKARYKSLKKLEAAQ